MSEPGGEVWHVISSEDLRAALRRVATGEDPEIVYLEVYVNSDGEQVPGEDASDHRPLEARLRIGNYTPPGPSARWCFACGDSDCAVHCVFCWKRVEDDAHLPSCPTVLGVYPIARHYHPPEHGLACGLCGEEITDVYSHKYEGIADLGVGEAPVLLSVCLACSVATELDDA